MKNGFMRKFLSDLLLSLGFIITISPMILYWFIHGDYERYIWIINGPYPFSNFGGGPSQIFMYMVLFVTGILLISISMILKRNIKK
ncbi:MAG: hypothetical protein WBJ13_09060 [Sedimentibacter sp.]